MTEPRTRYQMLALLAAFVPFVASAAVIDAVNGLRRHGCPAHEGRVPPLTANARLDEVARHLARGEELREAEHRAGYHAASSFSVHVAGVPPGGDVARTLGQRFCEQLMNPAFRELGSWRRGSEVWLALAEPFTVPAAGAGTLISHRVLELANEARAHARRCGSTPFAAAPPLALSSVLERAALEYAREMARYGYMDHTGRDGSSPAQRITRSGYRWREVGENLARGMSKPEEVVAGWLRSPAHCANLMDPAFREMGVAYALNPRDEAGVYWALE